MAPRSSRRLIHLVLVAACAHPPAPSVPAVQLSWTPFYWVTAGTDSVSFKHAAILFRVLTRPNRPPSLVQLDLAGSGNLPDGLPEPAGAIREPRPLGKLYGLLGSRGRLVLPAAQRDSSVAAWQSEQIGTVGLPNYLQRALLLDFVHDRLAVADKPEADALAARAVALLSIPAGQYDRAEVPLTGGNGRRYSALLDTGLSPFPLWTTRAVWEELTGLAGPGGGTRVYRLPHPRGELVFVGGPARRGVKLGDWQLPPTEVVYLADAPGQLGLEAWQPPVDAILGPSLFAGRLMLLVDLPGRRVGLLRP